MSPLPPLYNVESIAEAFSYLERHHFSLQCCLYHLQTKLFYGEGILLVVYRLLADILGLEFLYKEDCVAGPVAVFQEISGGGQRGLLSG